MFKIWSRSFSLSSPSYLILSPTTGRTILVFILSITVLSSPSTHKKTNVLHFHTVQKYRFLYTLNEIQVKINLTYPWVKHFLFSPSNQIPEIDGTVDNGIIAVSHSGPSRKSIMPFLSMHTIFCEHCSFSDLINIVVFSLSTKSNA